MPQDGGEEAVSPEKFHESFRNRHAKEADRLRSEIEVLVRQANLLLHGHARLPPRPMAGKRNEGLLEATLEKAAWYRNEIKRLRKDLESWDRLCGGPHCGAAAQDRDPMETYNLLVEKRKELQRIQRNGQGLDRVAAAQRRAEVEQNAMSPEVEERLRHAKDEVEQQKRLHIRMQAERQKVVAAKKKAEQELRAANNDLRGKAAQLQRPPRPSKQHQQGGSEPQQLRHLRRDVDILSEAVWQDDRKNKAKQRDDDDQIDFTRKAISKLRAECAGHEAAISKLRALGAEDPSEPMAVPAASPRGGAVAQTSAREVPSPYAEKSSKHSSPSGQKRSSPSEQKGQKKGQSAAVSPAVSSSAKAASNSPARGKAGEADLEESDDMAALVDPRPAATGGASAPTKCTPDAGGGSLNIADIGAKIIEASISGLLEQKLQAAKQRQSKG